MEYSGPLARTSTGRVCIWTCLHRVCVPRHACVYARVQTRGRAAAAHALPGNQARRFRFECSLEFAGPRWYSEGNPTGHPFYLSISPLARSTRSARTNLIRGEFPPRADVPSCNLWTWGPVSNDYRRPRSRETVRIQSIKTR